MNRREFFQLSARAAAITGYGFAPALGLASSGYRCREMTVAEFHGARKFVPTEQGRIACLDVGEGPAALFLHGFPLNSFQWRGVVPLLSMLRRCIAPDFLGLGYTEVTAGQNVGAQAQVAMIAQLLDKLGVSAVDIVANDSGGAVAQLLVARYPDRARSLLLTAEAMTLRLLPGSCMNSGRN